MLKQTAMIAALVLSTAGAQAATYNVDALANSSTGGTALSTITLAAGESFTVLAGIADLWSAGPLPRYSNANGLTANLFATGADESGATVGTLIGQNWNSYTQDGFTAAYGQLVGKIGSQYFALGTNSGGTATSAGTLQLFYWDSNGADNFGSIAVNVSAVPEPATYAMLLAGLGLMGLMVRRRTSNA